MIPWKEGLIMKRQTALYMLEWFVYTVVAVGFGRGGLADAGRRRGLDGRVDHAGAVCGPAGACGALLPVLEHRRVGCHVLHCCRQSFRRQPSGRILSYRRSRPQTRSCLCCRLSLCGKNIRLK